MDTTTNEITVENIYSNIINGNPTAGMMCPPSKAIFYKGKTIICIERVNTEPLVVQLIVSEEMPLEEYKQFLKDIMRTDKYRLRRLFLVPPPDKKKHPRTVQNCTPEMLKLRVRLLLQAGFGYTFSLS